MQAQAEVAIDTSNDIPLETASRALVAFVSNVNTYLGLRWLDSYRAWVETASQSSGQACEAAFVTGFAICDVGPFVTFPGNDGKQINAGCGCGGIYVTEGALQVRSTLPDGVAVYVLSKSP